MKFTVFTGAGIVGGYVFLLAGYIFHHWCKHRAWKREHARKVRVFEFWKAQCDQALREGNNEAFRVNLRRYEREVLGREE